MTEPKRILVPPPRRRADRWWKVAKIVGLLTYLGALWILAVKVVRALFAP